MTAHASRAYARYVAIGDSSTEGLDDPDGRGGYRGWANRLAAHVVAAQDAPLLYANLAVRGRKTREVRKQQLGPALAMHPDLVTVFSGVNDVARRYCNVPGVARDMEEMFSAFRATGATVLTITMPDLSEVAPVARLVRKRLLELNDRVREASARTGVHCVDLAGTPVTGDLRLWSDDRLHANSEGHRRIAAALAHALGLRGHDASWAEPLPESGRSSIVTRIGDELRWTGEHLVPWLWRHARGVSSGDGRTAKRPTLETVSDDNV
ncbi:MAG: SGNH/GDSL hydrolase family protein [Gemmatimonadota bacterium]|nr:SGNH/GDSL hydrolase family protein [Gemmatimonadota bacterium]